MNMKREWSLAFVFLMLGISLTGVIISFLRLGGEAELRKDARLNVYTEACEEAGGLPLVHDGTVFCIDPRAVQEMGS